jgi:hypothetical protein
MQTKQVRTRSTGLSMNSVESSEELHTPMQRRHSKFPSCTNSAAQYHNAKAVQLTP